MNKILLITSIYFFFHVSYAQISIKVENTYNCLAALSSLQGEKISFTDSIISNAGKFHFNLSSKRSGIYRLLFNSNKWIDFIYDNEEIEIETDQANILDSLKIIKSESNKIYYEFIKLNKAYKTKTELL
ncbi:MAG: hypothetical protein A2W11_12180 [Ignavibacteria bacterium RBG_16_35_7]|nr:MAG: hypothetical protein A2W11_12180 [Ignavibacteria bacterium RBG_16_35_7]